MKQPEQVLRMEMWVLAHLAETAVERKAMISDK